MRVYVSYARSDQIVAERVAVALSARGHQAFVASSAPMGEAFSDAIRRAIRRCDVFVFLISPHSLQVHSYAMTELALAKERWPRPADHVLPVMVHPTALEDIPAYLGSIGVLKPTGDAVIDVVASVERFGRHKPLGRAIAVAPAMLWVGSSVAIGWLCVAYRAPPWFGYVLVALTSGSGAIVLMLSRERSRRSEEVPRLPGSRSEPLGDAEAGRPGTNRAQSDSSREPRSGVNARKNPRDRSVKRTFVSYAHEDTAIVLPVASALQDRGLSVWVDKWDIVSGADWDASIDAALADCDVMLIHLSPRAIQSNEVRGELFECLKREKVILPVLIEECAIPRQLLSTHMFDLTANRSDPATMDRLAKDLRSHLGRGSAAEAATTRNPS